MNIAFPSVQRILQKDRGTKNKVLKIAMVSLTSRLEEQSILMVMSPGPVISWAWVVAPSLTICDSVKVSYPL